MFRETIMIVICFFVLCKDDRATPSQSARLEEILLLHIQPGGLKPSRISEE
jgi:hypothetical protein